MVKEKLIPMGNYICIKETGNCVLCRIYSLTQVKSQATSLLGKSSWLSYVEVRGSGEYFENYIFSRMREYKEYFRKVD